MSGSATRKCFGCGCVGEGHFARECPRAKGSQKSRGRINAVGVRYDSTDLLWLKQDTGQGIRQVFKQSITQGVNNIYRK